MALRAKAYFQDYDLEETLDADGRVKREYVYHGDRFERDLPESKQRAERIVGVVFGVLAAVLLVLAMRQQTPANLGGVFSMLSIFALIPAFCTLVGAVLACFKRGKLTKNDYHERIVLLRVMPLVGAALLLAVTVGYGVDAFRGEGAAWIAFGCSLAAALLYAAIGIRELSVRYIVHKGTKPSPERKGIRALWKEKQHE